MKPGRIKNPLLVNAAAMAAAHPVTFQRPSADELSAIGPGAVVKVCTREERFWVKVESIGPGGILVGVVANLLLFTPRLFLGDRMRLTLDNVYAISAPAPKQEVAA